MEWNEDSSLSYGVKLMEWNEDSSLSYWYETDGMECGPSHQPGAVEAAVLLFVEWLSLLRRGGAVATPASHSPGRTQVLEWGME